MRKIVLLIILIGIIGGGVFAYNNLRGVGPAINPPVRNITKTLDQQPASAENNTNLPLILPPGFSISIFAQDLDDPRVLTSDTYNRILVSSPSEGKIFALEQLPNETLRRSVVVDGLNRPHGVTFLSPLTLYIAETDGVTAYDYNPSTAIARNRKKLVDLPGGGNHFSRTIGIGPDGRLYISVGSSCNVCNEQDFRRAKILVADADGKNLKVFASGLRNSVFFTWHPVTKKLWATDMGRDLIGDDIPPEEVNIVEEGKDYGWPYCYGQRIWDKTFDPSEKAQRFCTTTVPAHIEMQAHSAPLGLAFIPDSWPEEYRGDLLVAFHGSWNRTEPTGYKVVRIKLDRNGNYQGIDDFISGWFTPTESGRTQEGVLGRPVDLLFDRNGALFISDDKAGVIYRVTYTR